MTGADFISANHCKLFLSILFVSVRLLWDTRKQVSCWESEDNIPAHVRTHARTHTHTQSSSISRAYRLFSTINQSLHDCNRHVPAIINFIDWSPEF